MFARHAVWCDLEYTANLFFDTTAVSQPDWVSKVGQYFNVDGSNARLIKDDLASIL
jgi:hypothetical protein